MQNITQKTQVVLNYFFAYKESTFSFYTILLRNIQCIHFVVQVVNNKCKIYNIYLLQID